MCNLLEETFSQTYIRWRYWSFGGNERQLMGTDRDPVPTCKFVVRNVVVLFLALYHVFKNMEPLSFDSAVETDVFRRFPTSA